MLPWPPTSHHRAGDLVDPLWGLLDMTPEGRGDFLPKVNYDERCDLTGVPRG